MSASVVLIQMRVCSHIIVVDPGFPEEWWRELQRKGH